MSNEPVNDNNNPSPEIEPMEVHHHTHHTHDKRNWKSYFWEFLMLFLAVTLGFFVENQREHYIENQRAKEFSKSLIKDLQNDKISVQAQVKSASLYIAIADSLLELSQHKLEGRMAARFSFYTRFVYWTTPIVWNRATFEQIKNSGSLRYFKNHELLEKIMQYDALINSIEAEAYNRQVRGNLLINSLNKIIDPAYHQKLSRYFLFSFDTISKDTMESYFATHNESLENKRDEIREMLNMVVVQQRNLRKDIEGNWREADVMINALISDLQKEYHIE